MTQIHDESAWIRWNIEQYATRYGVDKGVALRVSFCESRFQNVPSVNSWEDSYGPFQEGSEFWSRHAKRFDRATDPKMRRSIEANIELAILVASHDGWGEWTCRPGSKDYNNTKKDFDEYMKKNANISLATRD